MAWLTKYEPHWMLHVAEKAFRRGCTYAEVGTFLKVTRNTLAAWLEEGADPGCKDEALVTFAQTCLLARAEYCGEARDVWRDHCLADPKAMAIEMKALFPEEYDRATTKNVNVNVTKKLMAEPTMHLSDEELRLKVAYEDMMERKALGK